MAAVMGDAPIVDAVVENLGLLDIIFALLGLGTAYKVVAGGAEE